MGMTLEMAAQLPVPWRMHPRRKASSSSSVHGPVPGPVMGQALVRLFLVGLVGEGADST